jgi:hypothetical protein
LAFGLQYLDGIDSIPLRKQDHAIVAQGLKNLASDRVGVVDLFVMSQLTQDHTEMGRRVQYALRARLARLAPFCGAADARP